MRWKQFAIDFDEVPPPPRPGKPPPAEDALFDAMQAMRVQAASKRLDMTDAFEEYAGTGTEKNSGVMAKNRFRSTMGTLFRGGFLTGDVLSQICKRYGTGRSLHTAECGGIRYVMHLRFNEGGGNAHITRMSVSTRC